MWFESESAALGAPGFGIGTVDTRVVFAGIQIVLGGAIVFSTGVLIGSS